MLNLWNKEITSGQSNSIDSGNRQQRIGLLYSTHFGMVNIAYLLVIIWVLQFGQGDLGLGVIYYPRYPAQA